MYAPTGTCLLTPTRDQVLLLSDFQVSHPKSGDDGMYLSHRVAVRMRP